MYGGIMSYKDGFLDGCKRSSIYVLKLATELHLKKEILDKFTKDVNKLMEKYL
jgi:hypothetical protein